MERAPRPFEIKVGGRSLTLELGKCAVALFRTKQEVDYLAVQDPEDEEVVIRIFNNQDFVRWLGGYAIEADETGILHRRTVYMDNGDGVQRTFREMTNWNPPTIEKESPTEFEEEMWLDIQTRDMEKEWEELNES